MSFSWLFTAMAVEMVNALPAAAVLVAATALAMRLIPGWNASTRYAAWWLCLLAILALPLGRRVAVDTEPHAGTSAVAWNEDPVSKPTPIVAPMPARMPNTQNAASVQPGSLMRVAVALWVLGVAFSLLGIARSYLWIRRRRAGLGVREDPVLLERCLERCPVDRRVKLYWSDTVRTPVATGFLRPAVLLPSRLVGRLEQGEIEDIVTHELAHMARRDDWVQLVDRLIGAVVWFHPLARWVLARIRTERELCCDDWVIRTGAPARSYAACLVKLAELRRGLAALSLGATAGKSEMARRIEVLLKQGRTVTVHVSLLWLAAAGLGLAALAVSTVHFPAVLAAEPLPFEPPSPPDPPAPPAPAASPAPAVQAAPPAPSAPPQARETARSVAGKARPKGFLAALNATGYGDLPVYDIINLKNNGVDEAFLLDLQEAGVGKLSVKELIRLRQHGVGAGYLRDSLSAGVPGLTIDDVVNFHNNGVKPELPATIHKLGFGPYSPKQIIDMTANGMKPELFQALKDYGIGQIDARDAIDAQANGVNGSHLREARQFGPNLTIRQIIRLKNAGVL